MMTFLERTAMIKAADWVPGPGQGNWDYNAYAALPDDGKRYEVVEGVLYMAPAPGTFHHKAVGKIFRHLATRIEDTGLGEVFIAPIDVELSTRDIVEPDVVVVLKDGLARITPSRIIGAPDLVVEVSSPSTAGHDRRKKQDAYARSGIPEYWIVDSAAQTVELLFLQNQAYQAQGVFAEKLTLPSKIVPAIADLPVEKFFR